jgi:CRISPR-associated protein Cst2
MTPFAGDITFNSRSGEKGRTSLYGTEVHATRFQYGFALTPSRLRERSRAVEAIKAMTNFGEGAGNHSRFLFDFSPESIVLRITEDPAPRLLYCFHQSERGEICAPELVRRVEVGDIPASELYIGGIVTEDPIVKKLLEERSYPGVKTAVTEFLTELNKRLQGEE